MRNLSTSPFSVSAFRSNPYSIGGSALSVRDFLISSTSQHLNVPLNRVVPIFALAAEAGLRPRSMSRWIRRNAWSLMASSLRLQSHPAAHDVLWRARNARITLLFGLNHLSRHGSEF